MKGTLVFIHGTGVRSPGYETLCNTIRERLSNNGFGTVPFTPCAWGNTNGVPLDRLSETLPPAQLTKGVGAQWEWDADVALWGILADDPLFELRIAGEQVPDQSGVAIGTALPEVVLSEHLMTVDLSGVDIGATGISRGDLRAALRAVAESAELAGAARTAGDVADPDLSRAIARATIGKLLADARASQAQTVLPLALDAVARDRLTNDLSNAIAFATKGGLKDWIKKRVLEYAKKKATASLRDHRSSITGLGMPGVGDILYYQRRGGEIETVVRQTLKTATRPVVAVGHSLGGIILVDLLSGSAPPVVDLLVTVGSQSPLFYAIDALENVRPGTPAPKPFTPWRNIYNRNDFLSYCALPILQQYGDIQDEPVDPGIPFPDSHSAYWYDDRVYELIKGWWPKD